jgi:aerobic carbon-monoxide dehydrogenase medium subunit
MKLPSFEYVAPATLADAAALLAKHSGDAKIIAGGQSLLPIMAFRLASPALLVDIARIPDLRFIRIENDGLHLGPLVRWCEIERSADVARHHPLLKEAVAHIAHYQVRNRGTIGGSLAHADPAAELPCIAVTCGATLSLFSGSGIRKVAADEFILGELETDLRHDEIIVDVHFPAWPGTRCWGFKEFAKRRGDFALGGVAVYVDLDRTGIATDCAIGILGASSRAVRLVEVERMIRGSRVEPELIRKAARSARTLVDPPQDIHASREYRKALIGTLLERALNTAITSFSSASMQ